MHVATLQVWISGLFFFFSLSINLTAEASHSAAESKESRIVHFERGMSAPANQRFGGTIRYSRSERAQRHGGVSCLAFIEGTTLFKAPYQGLKPVDGFLHQMWSAKPAAGGRGSAITTAPP